MINLFIRSPWTESEIAELKLLVHDKVPLRLMRLRLGRSGASICGRLKKITVEEVHLKHLKSTEALSALTLKVAKE